MNEGDDTIEALRIDDVAVEDGREVTMKGVKG